MTTRKTALITGANRGIGFEVAKKLAKLGYFVYIGSRDKSNGLKAVEELKILGFSNIDTLEIDVTNTQSVEKAKEELQSKIPQLDRFSVIGLSSTNYFKSLIITAINI